MPAKRHKLSSSAVCLQSFLVDKLSPWGLQSPHPWSSSAVCLQSLLVDKLSPWGLQRPHPWSSSVVCLQSLLVDKLSPWGLQCLHPWSSSVVCLQSLLVDKLSPRGLQCLHPCSSSAVCNHCLWTSCHPGVSSVPTPGVPAWCVCNHCLWTSCRPGVSSVSTPAVPARYAIIACGQVVTLGSPASPLLEFQHRKLLCGKVSVNLAPKLFSITVQFSKETVLLVPLILNYRKLCWTPEDFGSIVLVNLMNNGLLT